MAQTLTQAPADSQLVALRVPPHSIEAEQSVLGGLLLDNGAWDKIGDIARGRRLLPRRSPAHLPPHRAADRARPAGRRRHGRRVDRVERGQGPDGRAHLPRHARAEHAVGAQHPPLRGDRARARGDAQARRGGRRRSPTARSIRRARRSGSCSTRPSRRCSRSRRRGSRGQAGFHDIHQLLSQVMERVDFLYSRDNPSDITGVADRVPRPRPHDLRAAGRRSHHRRRPPEHGQDRARAQHRRARRGAREAPGRGVQHGDVGHAARGAHARLDGAHRPAQAAHRPAHRRGLEPARRRRSASCTRRRSTSTRPGRSTRSSCARARGASRRQYGKLGLIVVDYLQLMVTGGRREENRATELSEISRSLKALAKELARAGRGAVAAQPQRRAAAPTSAR